MAFTKATSDFDTLIGGDAAGRKVVTGTYNGVVSYAAGGEAITAASIDSNATSHTIRSLTFGDSNDQLTRYSYDRTNAKVTAFVNATGAQVADAVDLTDAVDTADFTAIISPT